MNLKLLIAILLLFPLFGQTQDIKRTAIWYFGENAGIDFNTTPPTALTDGQVNTIEGCASICDTNGNLLFYTDGRTVWNKYHDTMPNGSGLLGGESSMQAAIIVPKPSSTKIYYLITTPSASANGNALYNIIDLERNSGLGEVIDKNIFLIQPVSEKQVVIRHRNNKDYWIVFRGSGNDEYYSFLLTENGIVNCPIISKIGINLQGYDLFVNQGMLKANSEGSKIAITVPLVWITELFDFNRETGKLSNAITLPNSSSPFGVEFSPNGKILYVTERNLSLIQFDISSGVDSTIKRSKKLISYYNSNEVLKPQLALDNKIYLCSPGKGSLAIIESPNNLDTFCNFDFTGFGLNGKNSLFGLPDFVTSFFHRPAMDFGYELECRTNTIHFGSNDTFNAVNYKWYFAKGNTTDSANTQNPIYIFTDTGNYKITFIASNSNRSDTISKNLFIHPKYSLNLGKDTVVCAIPFVLNAGSGQFCYTWQDSSSNSTFEVTKSGKYHVKVVTPNHCTQFDTINITVAPPPAKPTITRNNDTLISSTAQSYQWYKNNSPINGAIQQKLKITQNAYYQVEIGDSNTCKALSDSFNFIYVGLDKIQQQRFVVYPNSAKDYLYITKPKEITAYTIQILDIQGKQIFSQQLSENTEEIPLNNIAAGIYVLQIIVNNQLQETPKLIITK